MAIQIDPKSIKPARRGQSDFFSWQLFHWVSKYPHRVQVFRNPHDEFDRPIIGQRDEEQWVTGTFLRELCTVGAPLRAWAFPPAQGSADWVDVTTEFWEAYRQKGVCAIHGDLVHKWRLEGDDVRVCDYCGKREIRQIERQSVEVWRCELTTTMARRSRMTCTTIRDR